MKKHVMFRLFCFLCLSVIAIAAVLNNCNYITDKSFGYLSAGLSTLATIFAIFSNKPIKEELPLAIDQILLHYDQNAFEEIRKAKEQEAAVREYVEIKSNEIFLLKLHGFLSNRLILEYKKSDLPNLLNEMTKIEEDLTRLKIPFDEANLPKRLKQTIQQLNSQNRSNLYIELLEQMSFFPFSRLIINYIKILQKFI